MKINCDVCNEQEASVFCTADEAALCAACDHRVHHANLLAGRHPRFSILLPSPKDSPLCDICQEKKAFLFCQRDRAILCNDCDVAIHKVNEHTQSHSRFLLTGVKLSPAATTTGNLVVPDQQRQPRNQEPVPIKKPVAASVPMINQTCSNTNKVTAVAAPYCLQKSNGSGHGSATASSISEYLIDMLPGWYVEDFLDSAPTFSKIGEDDPAVFWDDELLEGSLNDYFLPETMGMWVPQAPPPAAPPPPPPPPPLHIDCHLLQPCSNVGFGGPMISGSSLVFAPSNINKITKSSRKRRSDNGNCLTVPQISPPPITSKRSRTLW